MNTELRPIHPLTGSNKHGKNAYGKQISDLAWQKHFSGISDQVAHFGATKLYATGPEHGKVKHGMELLKELNKSPLVTLSQKGSENTIASM